MRLGVFGDSYAHPYYGSDWSENSWPALIHKNSEDHYGQPGTSVWNSFKKFLENYKKYTHVVFVYTMPHRIHSLPDYLERYAFMLFDDNPQKAFLPKSDMEEMKTVWDALRYTQDLDLDTYLSQKIFDDVNRICKENNIKLVNILPFEGVEDSNISKPIQLTNIHGSCITGLVHVSTNETARPLPNEPDPRPCHLSEQNNKILYNMINELIDSDEIKIINAKEKGIFVL